MTPGRRRAWTIASLAVCLLFVLMPLWPIPDASKRGVTLAAFVALACFCLWMVVWARRIRRAQPGAFVRVVFVYGGGLAICILAADERGLTVYCRSSSATHAWDDVASIDVRPAESLTGPNLVRIGLTEGRQLLVSPVYATGFRSLDRLAAELEQRREKSRASA